MRRTASALIGCRTGDRPADPTGRSSGRGHGSVQGLGAVSSQYRSGRSPALAHATIDSRSKQRDRSSCQQDLHSLSRWNTSAHSRRSRAPSTTDAGLATGGGSRRIDRSFRFRDFREALTFVQEIGELAEAEGHHPDISFGWGNATVSLQTKKIKGLHENDFIMATKIDRIYSRVARV